MPDPLTHAELDAAVRSLRAVGSPYDYVAAWVEHYNRPHCIGGTSGQKQSRSA